MGYETIYQQGAYRQGLISGWLTDLGEASMIQTVFEHEAFDDWWHDLSGPYMNQWDVIDIQAAHFAGWYDIFGTFQLNTVVPVNLTG